MSMTTDDQPTLRLPSPGPRWRVIGSAKAAQLADDGEPRRRVEIGALVFGTLLAGILIAALWEWSHDQSYPRAQTQLVIFMSLTSGAVVGIFVSAVAASSRRTRSEMRREVRLAVRSESEAQAEKGMALLRTVAFQLNDNRRVSDEHARQIFRLVADALERGGFASADEVADLRSRVEELAKRADGPDEVQLYLQARHDIETERRDGGDS